MLSRNWRRISASATHPTLSQRFSENKTSLKYPVKLTDSAQEAFWASLILKIIKKYPNPSQINKHSLRDYLMSISTFKSNSFIFNDQSTQQFFKSTFVNGVYLDRKVFTQTRITDQGIQQQVEDTTEQTGVQNLEETSKSKEKYPQEPFIFCPNVLITRQIMRLLWRNRKSLLICGGYGTSKTVSIILFCYLTGKIHKFFYEASNQSSQQSQEAKYLNIDQQAYPRTWYWTINWKQVKRKGFNLKGIMLAQAKQLPEQTRQRLQKIQSFSQFKDQLRDQFNNNIRHKVIIDQFNVVASKIRRWNNKVQRHPQDIKDIQQKIKQLQQQRQRQIMNQQAVSLQDRTKLIRQLQGKRLQKNRLIKQFQRELAQERPQIRRVIQLIDSFLGFGAPESFVLNSSMNIEHELIDNTILPSSSLKLKLNLLFEHQKCEPQLLKFQQVLHEDWARYDFYHFFWFQIEENLRSKNLSDQFIKDMRKDFLTFAKDIKLRKFARFLWIGEFLKSNYSSEFNSITSDQTIEKTKPILQKLVSYFEEFYIKKCKQNIKVFLNKKDDLLADKCRKEILFDIFYVFALEYKMNNQKSMEFKVKDLNKLVSVKQAKIVHIYELLLSKEHNDELLPLRYDSYNQTVCFDWLVQEFLTIAKEYVSPGLALVQLESNEDKQLWSQDRAILRNYLLCRMIEVMNSDVVVGFFYPFLAQNQRYNHYVGYAKRHLHSIKIKIKDKLGFQTFDQKLNEGKKVTIRRNLQKVIEAAKASPGQSFLALPTNKDKFVPNNKVVDFILVKQDTNSHYIVINSFAVSIKKQISGKIKDSKEFWIQMCKSVNAQKQRYIITHTIICKDKLCRKSQRISSYQEKDRQITLPIPFQIHFSPFQDLTFENTNNHEAEAIKFKMIQEYVKGLDEETKQ